MPALTHSSALGLPERSFPVTSAERLPQGIAGKDTKANGPRAVRFRLALEQSPLLFFITTSSHLGRVAPYGLAVFHGAPLSPIPRSRGMPRPPQTPLYARPLALVVNSSALPSDPSAGRLTPPRLLPVDAPLIPDSRRPSATAITPLSGRRRPSLSAVSRRSHYPLSAPPLSSESPRYRKPRPLTTADSDALGHRTGDAEDGR